MMASRKLSFTGRNALLFILLIAAAVQLKAQTVVINTGTAGTPQYNAGPIYRSAATSAYDASRYAYLYTQSELAAAGILPGSIITQLGWAKNNNATSTGGGIFRIYMKNSSAAAFAAATETWANLNSATTMVYQNLSFVVPATTAPTYITFLLTTPFTYTGGSLEISTEWDINGVSGDASTGTFDWLWSTVPDRIYGTGNTTLAPITTLSSTTNSISDITDRRPFIQITYTPGTACAGTPVGGNTVSSASVVCNGVPFTLSLSGATNASGISYQWQISSDNNNWVDIGSATGFSYNATQSASNYYRARLICSDGSPAAYSASVLVTTPASPSGVYTINKAVATGGGNFNSFNAAYDFIKCGIAGAITFNVVPGTGPYNEQLIMNAVPGASATNTVTFNGKGNTLSFLSANTNERGIIKLDGAKHITFDSLVITASGSTTSEYGFGVHLLNNADSNNIRKCTININNTTTSTNYAGIVVSGSATSATTSTTTLCDANTFDGNTILGGYYGVILYGSTTAGSLIQNNKITNNVIQNYYLYGVYVQGSISTLVEKNDISRADRTASGGITYGIYFTGLSTSAKISKNSIHNIFDSQPTTTNDLYGIYLTGVDATVGAENVVSNNQVYSITCNGIIYGMYNASSDNAWYFHNTISLDHAGSTSTFATRGFYQLTAATGIQLKNNLITISRGGSGTRHAIYMGTTTTTFTSDYNDFYVEAGANNFVGYNGSNQTTLANWQAATGKDANSVSLNPVYIDLAGGNLRPTNAALNDKGNPAPGITTDIINAPRSAVTPDIGAYEFTVGTCSAPPTAGTATTNVTGPVCPNTLVSFNLTGNSIGVGQTYQWQSAATPAGPWTPVSGVLTAPSFDYSVATTRYYRAAVTCSGNTTYSTTVLITVNLFFGPGTYTIDKNQPVSATNFQSFNAAYDAMKCGLGGPVVFNVVAGSGPYNEQLIMGAIQGASATNTITFNGNGNTISFLSSNTNERAVIKLNGTDHVRFNNLVITATGTTTSEYGWGIQLMNNADSNTVNACTINIDKASTSTNYAGIVVSISATSAVGTGTNECDFNTFSNNTVNGGYYGVTLIGSTTVANGSNKIINNDVREFYQYGIYMSGSFNTLVEGNTISRPTRATVTAFYGVYVTSLNVKANITRNIITNPFGGAITSTSTFYGMYFTGSDPLPTLENIVSNNAIYNLTGSGDAYGLYNTTSDNTWYYHNTISMDGPAASASATAITRGFYQTTQSDGLELKNNIITISRGGAGPKHALYFNTPASTIVSDRNDLYRSPVADNAFVGYFNGNRATLTDWQTASAQDANSVASDPIYTNITTGDLKPTNASIDNIGRPVGIMVDILNLPRSATTPDLGAWEFFPGGCAVPPTPGAATATPDTVCVNTNVALKLSGNSTGTGQTYQWQTSATLAGTYTNIGNVLTNPDSVIVSSSTLYYRVAVTCGGNTAYSTPVLLVVNPALPAGTYTINKNQPASATNFASFNAAKDAMSCGIAGPVVFNVVAGSGPYNEQLILDTIAGTSAINTITFNGNGNTIAFSSSNTNERAVIKLRRTDYVIFDSLTIDATGTGTYGYGVQLINNADNNTFRKCVIHAVNNSTSTNYSGIIINSSETGQTTTGNTFCDNNTFDNNEINGGYYGITLVGSTTVGLMIDGNRIINNRIREPYIYPVYISGTSNTLVEGNDISRPTRTTISTGYGIYSTGLSNKLRIIGNKIHDLFGGAQTSTTISYGIYITGSDPVAADAALVANNIIYNILNNGAAYGLYNSSSDNVHYYHNTLAYDYTGSTATGVTRGFYQITEALGIEVKNNIITIKKGGTGTKHALYFATATSTIVSNYNDLFITPSPDNFIGYDGTDRVTLADWQAATAQDANSISIDPEYTDPSTGDLTPTVSPVDNKGTPAGVATDIRGVTRSATTPDVGAFEFSILPCVTPPTAGASAVTPNSGICLGATVQLTLSGNSTGGTQTYQWQSAASSSGPWTNISGLLNSPKFIYTIGTQTWFRAAVTCSGNTVYSTPVQVILNPALLSGTYTINKTIATGGTNYNSFAAAVAALECGITGTVIFNVAANTYDEQIRMHAIAGTSANSRVIFRSANGNASSVTLRYDATDAASNYVLKLDSASYVTYNAITITGTNATNGRVVELANTSSYDSLVNCVINAPASTGTSNTMAGIYADNLTGSDNVIKRNTFNNGSSGIYFEGTAAATLTWRNVIDSNTVNGAYYYGIYTGFNGRVQVTNNTVNTSQPLNSTAYGIYATNDDSAYQFVKNTVKINNTTGTVYGIYVTGSNALPASMGRISSNTVTAETNNTGTVYGMYLAASDYANFVNNVVSVNNSGASTYGLYSTTSNNINFYNNSVHSMASSATNNFAAYFNHTSNAASNVVASNNIFSHGNNGIPMFIASADYVSTDYNMFYTNGPALVRLNTTNYATLKDWRDAAFLDMTSIVYKPAFVSNTDLRPDIANPEVWAIHGRGVQIPDNDRDFNNNTRPTTLAAGVPDLGAFEFLPTSTPPVLTPVPAAPAAGTTQVFMFGTDTVTKIIWAPSSAVPSTIALRRYSGVVPAGLPATFKHMYFYVDVDVTGAGPFNYNLRQYYIDSWQGTIEDEYAIRLGRTDATNTWINDATSTLDDISNVIFRNGLTTIDKFTGLKGDNVLPPVDITPVDNSNKGTRFWVGYGHHQFMEPTWSNEQNMVLYLGAEQPAVVTVRINGTTWSRTYNIPANTVITSSILPKAGLQDARLLNEGLSKKGISIISDVPITAYAHIYGNLSSGATMLMPVGTYGYEYYALTSRQNYGDDAFSWFYVIADRDNTLIEITPSNPTRGGRLAGVPFTVLLKKGEVYQVLGAIQSGNDGYDLTGSRVRSIANADGKCYPVAMFSGSSRTNIACNNNPGSFSGDNIIQQNFPYQAWGRRYLTAPMSASTAAATLNRNIYRVAVKDASTVVKRNGVPLTGLINNYYYQFESVTADYIESDKPVMVAQYMPSSFSSTCTDVTGTGDPEMVYISPLEQGIRQVALYRNTQESITVNYLTLIIPNLGVPSLRIDGSATFDYQYAHPNLPGYTVVVKRWTAAQAQTIVQSDSAFTAITYGMGTQESYGYNAGTLVMNLNAQPAIINVFNNTGANNDYTCAKTPFRFHVLVPVRPTQLEWKFSAIANMTPNADVVQNNPVPVDSVVLNGRKYYKFTVAQDYSITASGTYYVPIFMTHPDIESCNNKLETMLAVKVIEKPFADFNATSTGCVGTNVQFTAIASSSNSVPISRWIWDFGDGTPNSTIQNPNHSYVAAGNYQVRFRPIATDGCVGDTTKPVVVSALPTVTITPDSIAVCSGSNATFNVQNSQTGVVYRWYATATGGTAVFTGASFTVNNVTAQVVYFVEADRSGCIGTPRLRVVAAVLPPLTAPVASVDSVGVNLIRFKWTAVPNAASYEVSINGGSTWSAPSSGATGLTHTVTGLQPATEVRFRVRAIGVIACQTATSAEVIARSRIDQIFIPNAFTPNNSGPAENNTWKIYGYSIKEMHVMVFNQWGEKLFESRTQSQGWDGTHRGKVQPSGVYVYVVKLTMLDGTTQTRKGSINLIR